MGVAKGRALKAGERERVGNQILWLVGLTGLVTREQLLQLLEADPKNCSTVDRALANLTGRPTGHRRGPLGAWRAVRPGLECPKCRMGTVAAVLVSGRGDSLRVSYGHGAAGSTPDEYVVCARTFDHGEAPAVRGLLDRFLEQPLPPALIEHQPGRWGGNSYLRLTDAGRELLVALRRDRGQAAIPVPRWSDEDHRATAANLACAEFVVELLAAIRYAQMPWLLPVRINGPGPRLNWTSGEEDHALTGAEATVARHLSVHTELLLPARRLWLLPIGWVLGREERARRDYRLVAARFELLCLLHRHPAPGSPSVYRRSFGDGRLARAVLLVPEEDRERLRAYVRTLRSPSWAMDSIGFNVHSARSLADYVCGHLGQERRG
jgi:hypothetical protein